MFRQLSKIGPVAEAQVDGDEVGGDEVDEEAAKEAIVSVRSYWSKSCKHSHEGGVVCHKASK